MMKKQNFLSIIAIVIAVLCFISNIVYFIAYSIHYGFDYAWSDFWYFIIPNILLLIASIFLIVGLISKNKVFLIISLGAFAAIYFIELISFIIYMFKNWDASDIGYYLAGVFGDLRFIFFIVAMIIIVLVYLKNNNVVKDKEQSIISNRDTTDEILEYKELLDSGAITQEEFDSKKKELLRL